MNDKLYDFRKDAYGEIAAMRYNIFERRNSGFANQIAPKIYSFYKQTSIGKTDHSILDVACGTGQLLSYFLNHDFKAFGLDVSSKMLEYAKENNAHYLATQKVKFVESNSSNFRLDQKFGLAVSTFNGMNHLESFEQVESSIASVFEALQPGAYFMFDINTQKGLKSVVDSVELTDNEEEITIRKRIFDGERVILNASGCFLNNGIWHRYKETIFKIIINCEKLRSSMLNKGWSSVTFTSDDFNTPVEDPEMNNVAYIVAQK